MTRNNRLEQVDRTVLSPTITDGLVIPGTHGVRRSVGVVSSRLPRDPAKSARWLDVLGHVVLSAVQHGQTLCTAAGITPERYLSAAATQLPLQLIYCELASSTRSNLLSRSIDVEDPHATLRQLGVTELPPPWRAIEGKLSAMRPMRDALVSAWPDRLVILRVRSDGLLQRWLQHQFQSRRCSSQQVVVAVGSGLVPESIIASWPSGSVQIWQPAAANVWQRPTSNLGNNVAAYGRMLDTIPARDASIVPTPIGPQDQYLKHWTRSTFGPWPEQSASDYYASLLFSPAERRRTARDALRRILRQARLRASDRLITGESAMVSFSEVPLTDFYQQRVFRQHLGRWDFEPYGIAILRNWLRDRGGRPVTYGPPHVARQLSELERLFFQPVSNPCDGTPRIDWRAEREWRIAGDVDLRQLSSQQALVFVPSEREAGLIAPWSRWPVTILPGFDLMKR